MILLSVEMSVNPQSDVLASFHPPILYAVVINAVILLEIYNKPTHLSNVCARIPNPINMKCLLFLTNSPFKDLE